MVRTVSAVESRTLRAPATSDTGTKVFLSTLLTVMLIVTGFALFVAGPEQRAITEAKDVVTIVTAAQSEAMGATGAYLSEQGLIGQGFLSADDVAVADDLAVSVDAGGTCFIASAVGAARTYYTTSRLATVKRTATPAAPDASWCTGGTDG